MFLVLQVLPGLLVQLDLLGLLDLILLIVLIALIVLILVEDHSESRLYLYC